MGMDRRQPITASSGKSRKSPTTQQPRKKLKKLVDFDDDESVESVEDEQAASSDEDEDEETVEEKRVRMARDYLKRLEEASDSSSDSESSSEDGDTKEGRDRISMKLQKDRLKREGTWERAVADIVAASSCVKEGQLLEGDTRQVAKEWTDKGHASYFRGHDLPVTCVALQPNGEKAVSGSKDNSVILWDIEKETKVINLCNQWKKGEKKDHRSNGEALAVACSDDERYVAVGRRDATVAIYDVRISNSSSSSSKEQLLVKEFKGHKGPITCLAFRSQSNQLFSGSNDRCIRHYSLDEMTYMETLYGHQAGITGIDCFRQERPISVGRDRTARAWKLAEDTHLIFRGGSQVSPADCVSVVKDNWFVSGHDDGKLCLWMTEKKKTVRTIDMAHGAFDGGFGRGITALSCLKSSDLVVSGSSDGWLRLWKASTGQTLQDRGMDSIGKIPVYGYINGVAVGPKARFCVVAVGQEPALGRWNRVSKAKNRFGIIRLRQDGDVNDDDDEEDSESAASEASDDDGDK